MLSVWIDTFQKMYGLVYQSLRSIERQKRPTSRTVISQTVDEQSQQCWKFCENRLKQKSQYNKMGMTSLAASPQAKNGNRFRCWLSLVLFLLYCLC
jgi:hypothetical protein